MQAAGADQGGSEVIDIHVRQLGVLMIQGMSQNEIRESLPEGFCDDCWQQSLDRQKQFNTDPETDYRWVFYVTHIWDGI
ncbi:MAG TPA: hypothetical protein VEF71_04575 [Streptosporangiaceae bacterium]|nr:hypothetical protein [Streptosporangiaceae bacterium]